MLIGELALKSHCTRDTIRFYEKNGLLRLPKGHRGANNYKNYPESFVDDLKLIRTMTSLGFKIEAIEAQLLKLTALRENLLRTQAQCGADCLIQDGTLGCT